MEYDTRWQRSMLISTDVAKIALDDAAPPRNRLVPMPQPPFDKGDRFDHVNVIRKTLFSLLEFREPPGEIALPVIAIITKSKVSFRQVRVERESTIGSILGCRQPRRAWIVP